MHSIDLAPVNPISPISFEHPCGADLEYDAEFIALQQVASGRREQQFGDTLIPAVAPDWRQVAALAIALLGRSIDLRVFALLTLAWTLTDGLEGYAKGISLTADTLDQFWEPIHPQLQVAGEFDPLPRLNALAAFTDRETLGHAARSATLLHWRLGPLSLRDAAAILEGKPASAANLGSQLNADLQAELRSVLDGAHSELAVVRQVVDAIERISGHVSVNLDYAWMPDLSSVEHPLGVVLRAAEKSAGANLSPVDDRLAFQPSPNARSEQGDETHLQQEPVRDEQSTQPSSITRQTQQLDPVSTSASAQHLASVPEPSTGPIALRSRHDALLALESVCRYLERTELSHPAPLLLRRAQRLMHMNFREIVRDMAPAALPQLDALAGEALQPAPNSGN
ncbi:type VI secretion system protein TssA [Paraburkholderia sp. BL21I4N1]|uniref:type VI secretion system protein TssA n=1 Tax=Paraburkholderia sp. BL21I4N1 TaxID=1938801 RepID=UPI000CFCF172|nr:type VI secretion system protein TssA [Paraburkholderia sp. BL21I4N1]PQV48773.1 type VI secretion system protein ImpA [Paraburkholderia sp. BL21I4N1]